jgi:hypothetical protein
MCCASLVTGPDARPSAADRNSGETGRVGFVRLGVPDTP